jgi:hypothetical protein
MATQAFQPFNVDGPGLLVVESPFVAYGSYWDAPGAEVLQTVAPGRAANDSCQVDRNAASKAGILFQLGAGTPDSTGRTCPGLAGDTLRVDVDLSATTLPADPSDIEMKALTMWLDELVPLTLKCGLYNARRRWPRVRFLEYRILGSEKYVDFSGVYDLQSIELPRGPFQDRERLTPSAH